MMIVREILINSLKCVRTGYTGTVQARVPGNLARYNDVITAFDRAVMVLPTTISSRKKGKYC